MKKQLKTKNIIIIAFAVFFTALSCGNSETSNNDHKKSDTEVNGAKSSTMPANNNGTSTDFENGFNSGKVTSVTSTEHFKYILANAGDKTLMFDLYADWCGPCKILAPVVREVAKEHKDDVSVYKIDTDKHQELAQAFRVRGIPHVAFIKNNSIMESLTGVRPKTAYADIIKKLE